MKTEAEARKCWCPFARGAFVQDTRGKLLMILKNLPAFNRFIHTEGHPSGHPIECNCIASECMAWRWGERWNKPDVNGKMVEQPREGCCGLAGKC